MKKQASKMGNSTKWKTMAGSTALEKRINRYLTYQFICNGSVPADECLSEARYIIREVERCLKKRSACGETRI